MYCFFDQGQNREAINISPGEYFVSSKGMLIYTLVGPCVSVALFDPEAKTGGLNHFSAGDLKDGRHDNIARQAEDSMKKLIEALVKNGCRKGNLEAKILGGSFIPNQGMEKESVDRNILFAEEYLKNEGIKVISRDTGGDEARKIYFYTDTFKVLLKRVKPGEELDKQMKDYMHRLKSAKTRACSR